MYINKININSASFPINNVYPFNLELLNNTGSLDFKTNVTFFMGENGSGKSTLLKAIAKSCGINIWKDETRSALNYNKYAENLYRYINPEWGSGQVTGSYFDSEIFRYFAECLDEWAKPDKNVLEYYGGESLIERSHGQRHLQYFKTRYNIPGIYFLDEPENSLSPKKQIEFLKILRDMTADGHAQFIIASHSPILLAYPGSVIYNFEGESISPVDYYKTEYYSIYRDFLNKPDSYIDII